MEHWREVCRLGQRGDREITSLSFASKECRWWDQLTFYPVDYRTAFASSLVPDRPLGVPRETLSAAVAYAVGERRAYFVHFHTRCGV
jgi:hypothetical protein